MFWTNNYEKNIFLLYLVYFFHALIISWNVIYVLFLQENSLNFFQISLLFLIGTLTTLLMEIPTGFFADLHGRKSSLIFFSIFIGLGSLIFVLFNSFYYFIFGVIFLGIGMAFFSGTTDSILFESLKKLKREKEYTKILSQNHFIFIGLGVLTNFSIPLLFEFNIKYPFIIALFFSILSFVVCLNFFEPIKKSKIKFQLNYITHFKSSFNFLINDYKLLWLILFSTSISLVQGFFGDILNQPFIKEMSSYLEYGILFATATVIQSILILYTEKIINLSKKFNSYLFIILVWCISLVLLLLIPFWTIPIVMGVVWFSGTLRYIFISSKINDLIKNDKVRATIHSTNSMFSSLIYLIILPIFGFILDLITLREGVFYLAIFSLVIGLIVLMFKK